MAARAPAPSSVSWGDKPEEKVTPLSRLAILAWHKFRRTLPVNMSFIFYAA